MLQNEYLWSNGLIQNQCIIEFQYKSYKTKLPIFCTHIDRQADFSTPHKRSFCKCMKSYITYPSVNFKHSSKLEGKC